jgi:hypothetical protein
MIFPAHFATTTHAVIGLDYMEASWVHILSARLGILWLTLHGFLTAMPTWAAAGYHFYYWQVSCADSSVMNRYILPTFELTISDS